MGSILGGGLSLLIGVVTPTLMIHVWGFRPPSSLLAGGQWILPVAFIAASLTDVLVQGMVAAGARQSAQTTPTGVRVTLHGLALTGALCALALTVLAGQATPEATTRAASLDWVVLVLTAIAILGHVRAERLAAAFAAERKSTSRTRRPDR